MKKSTRKLSILLILLVAAGAHARQADDARPPAWQVTRFDLNVSISAGAAERSLSGRAVINARNVGEGTGRTFTVRLNPSAEIKTVTVGGAEARVQKRTDPLTKLLQAQVVLPAPVAPGGAVSVTIEYRLPVAENTGLAAVSGDGAQFLPLSFWYPTPNTNLAPRGADYAPYKLTLDGAPGGTVVSAGQAAGGGFDETLSAQPFFLTGKWDAVEGTGEARGMSALLAPGAPPEERKRAENLLALAAAARAFYAGLLGPAPDVPVRLVAVRRGGGFDMAGTLLLDHAAFRRPKTDAVTALFIAEALARLWVGGATAVEGAGAGVIREGLPRFLATLFLEKQFGREVAEAERERMALLYAPVARRDGPLSQATPASDIYFNTVANKGALVWRLLMEKIVGREAFTAALRGAFGSAGGRVSLASLRAALGDRPENESLRALFAGLFDQPTDTDFLVGLPQQKGGQWASALRNLGALDAEVTVEAVTERGERLTTNVRLPARDFAEAKFQSPARIARVEVDPEKLYPQVDYSNDTAPRTPPAADAVAEARTLLTQQKPAEAERLMREVLARAPRSEEARVLLGRALIELNRLDDAERELRAALDSPLPTPSTLAWANVGLGEIAQRRNQAAEAARRFDEAARADAEYASTLAARNARIRAEAAANAAPAPDEQIRAAVERLDQAIRAGRKADLDALIAPGELSQFSKGIVANQPEQWQTRLLRTEPLGTNTVAADVRITARTLGKDQEGTALLVFTRADGGWKLSDIRFFEVR